MSIQEVADLLGVSKKKVWQAVKDGALPAQKVQKGNAWRYLITTEGVEAYRAVMDTPAGWEPFPQRAGNVSEQAPQRLETPGNATATPPVELWVEMLDRLQRSERRAMELELQLRQSQRLLAENAESILEREARARQAEAKANQLAATLEATKPAQKRSGLLGWLGFRRSRTTDTSTAESV